MRFQNVLKRSFSATVLADYEYVQQCLKMNDDIKLVLMDLKHVPKAFKRTVNHHYYGHKMSNIIIIVIFYTFC